MCRIRHLLLKSSSVFLLRWLGYLKHSDYYEQWHHKPLDLNVNNFCLLLQQFRQELMFLLYCLVFFTILHSFTCLTYEPTHDKTNKMTLRLAKIQISLGIRPIWSESSLCTHLVAKSPSICPGWSESSLGAHAILLVLPWDGSFIGKSLFLWLNDISLLGRRKHWLPWFTWKLPWFWGWKDSETF